MSTSSQTKDLILARIRQALGPEGTNSPGAEHAAIARTYQQTGTLAPEARLEMFKERLYEYDARVVESSEADLAATIASILKLRNQKTIAVANEFSTKALPEGFTLLNENDLTTDQLQAADGILTTCFAGIAFTGSIVLRHGPGEGARKFTLLPDRHLCVVREEQVVETVPEAIARLAPYTTSPITFISGPSATADIEMTRIRGVHGPRFLDVVLVR